METITQQPQAGSRSAFIALVGKPNVGKSSLLNRLVGEKVAIVTQKPQTTRTRITGVLTKEETQLVFIDTPGLLKAKDALGRYMVKQVNDSVADVDLAVLVTEPGPELSKADEELVGSFRRLKLPAIAVVNKVDTLEKKEAMLAKLAALGAAYDFRHIIPVSALTGEGVDTLLAILMESAGEGVHFFPDDALTDQPERVLCAEMIREKILLHMRQEIPHGVAVMVEEMKDRPPGAVQGRDPHGGYLRDDLLRAGWPQGDAHRQGGADAAGHRHRGPAGYGELPGGQGESPVPG